MTKISHAGCVRPQGCAAPGGIHVWAPDSLLDSISGVVSLAICLAAPEIGAFEALESEIHLLVRFVMAIHPCSELSLQAGQSDLYPNV